jgi:hypothetical protein
MIGEPVLYSDIHLHASYYAPAAHPERAVLLIPPLFEEKRCAHRAMTTCAQALAAAGVAVLHPDFFGVGNSHGALTEIALDRWLDDLHAAADYLAERTANTPLTMLACRAGALLAAQAIAAGGISPAKLLLWHPVTHGRGYLHQLKTRRMIQDSITGEAPPEVGPYEVEGHALSPALFAEFQALQLPAKLPGTALTLIQCSFNDKLLAEYERLLAQWGVEALPVRRIICEPFWRPHTPTDYHALVLAIVEEVTV